MNKKLLVFGGVFLLVIIALFSLFLQFSPSSQRTKVVNNSSAQPSPNSVGNPTTVSSSLPSNVSPSIALNPSSVPADWQVYSGGIYTLKYPANWSIQDQSLTGYKIIKLSPIEDGYYDPIAPYIKITEVVNSNESLQERESLGISNDLKYTKTNIGGKLAYVSSGIVDGPVINGQSYGKLQGSISFVQSGNYQFIIQTLFSNSKDRVEDSTIVNIIMSSIKIF